MQPEVIKNTKSLENAGGGGIVYISRIVTTDGATALATTITIDMTTELDLITLTSVTGFSKGDYCLIGDTSDGENPAEVIRILGIEGNKIKIKRNVNIVDDEYLIHSSGDAFVKIAKRNSKASGAYDENATSITVDDGSKFKPYDILRVKKTEERIQVQSRVGNDLTVLRNFNLQNPATVKKNQVEYDIESGDTLEQCAYGRFPDCPIGNNEDINVTPSEDLIETFTVNEGRGAIYSQGKNYNISMTLAKTHLLSIKKLIYPLGTVQENSKYKGRALYADIGEKKQGIAVYVKPKAENTGTGYFFPDTIFPSAEEVMAIADQRQLAVECMVQNHTGLDLLGVEIEEK